MLKAKITIICTLFFTVLYSESNFNHTSKKRSFHFVYTANISAPKNKSEVQKIWLPIPQTNAYQDVTNVVVHSSGNLPFSFHHDKIYGNKIAYFEIIDPRKTITITVKLDCTRYQNARDNFDNNVSHLNPCFLTPTNLLVIDNNIKKLAAELTMEKQSDLQKLHAVYNEVLGQMKYSKPLEHKGNGLGTGWGDGSTKWAMNKCFGNCTDFHSYYISLLRAINIPSRFEIGAWLHADKPQGKVGYHCWAFSWNSQLKQWFPVDISEAWKSKHLKNKEHLTDYYFGNLCVNRIQFTVGRDLNLSPKQQQKALNYFIYPYCEVDGNVIATNASFSYIDK
ncbi:transglutaminase-like domain-containing protein [Candidatus Uabimicrobium sp. HlEnr_7]|uniref:transglutaminase-like domain-containing protein n=1 Tax=Candidatus Uabimicrobium helgolandensis TaxID=3095367 RepID=UPI003556890B